MVGVMGKLDVESKSIAPIIQNFGLRSFVTLSVALKGGDAVQIQEDTGAKIGKLTETKNISDHKQHRNRRTIQNMATHQLQLPLEE